MEGIVITGMIIAGVVAMCAIIGFITIKEERIKAQGKGAAEDQARFNADTAAELARLRNRLEVLERVITDDDRKLARDIVELRSTPARAG